MSRIARPIMTVRDMDKSFAGLAEQLLRAEPFDRGEVHAQKTTTPEMVTRELCNVSLEFEVPTSQNYWAQVIQPNLPWAEDHFQERVCGEPMNPPPSNEWWPYAQAGNKIHKRDRQFSHTYPERFWPKMANVGGTTAQGRQIFVPHVGVRFEYGDLGDVIELLKRNPRSRQAYLPVWFPEDLNAANRQERVPCTLGYHFLLTRGGELDVTYYMRSCDLVRFFRDDVYMAGRLLQWVGDHLDLPPGVLRMHVANLHAFVGDDFFLKRVADHRASYDFRGMM